jgi:hypothetical protein
MVLFISEKYIKDNSIIDNNVDDKLLAPLIILAQDKYILPLTGTSLWNDLIAQIKAGTVSADYQDLLDNYLQRATLWWTMAEAVLPLSYKFTNKNVMQKISDNSHAATMSDLLKLKDQFVQNAEYYSERATRHLRANTGKYPLYLQVTVNCLETVTPQHTGYNTGIYLGDGVRVDRHPSFREMYQGKNGFCAESYDNEYYYYNA